MREDTVKNCKILVGCFVIQFLVSGATRLSSIYFVECITRYDVDRKQASFPFVITYMVKNLAGPVMGFLEQIIGMKWIIAIGCIMATLGIGGCFFAEEILVITILWGVVLGFSYGFTQNMQAPLLNQHFKRNKNKANGFVSTGSSLGGILLPVIATACIQTFGTSGSFLLISAVIAHSIPASLLIENPIIKTLDRIPKENIEVINKDDGEKNESPANISNTVDYLCKKQTNKCLSSSNVENTYSEDLSISNPSLNNSESNKTLANISNTAHFLNKEQTHIYLSSSTVKNVSYEDLSTLNSSLNKNLENRKHSINELSSCDSSFSLSLNKATNKKEQRENVGMFGKTKFAFRNFQIFIDPTFIVILIFNGLMAVIIVTVWTIILDFVRDKEVPESLEIYYIILLPLTDILGRLGSGYITDKNFLNFSHLCFITLLIEATALISIVYVNNFILLMAFEVVISICFGMTIVLQITMVDNFMEEDLKIMAHSCRVMLYAPLGFTISPMLGYFRGGYGSYDNVFYILSGTALFCGCSVCLLPYLAKRRHPVHETQI